MTVTDELARVRPELFNGSRWQPGWAGTVATAEEKVIRTVL